MTKATDLRAVPQTTDIRGIRSVLRSGASALVLGGMLMSTAAMAQDTEEAADDGGYEALVHLLAARAVLVQSEPVGVRFLILRRGADVTTPAMPEEISG